MNVREIPCRKMKKTLSDPWVDTSRKPGYQEILRMSRAERIFIYSDSSRAAKKRQRIPEDRFNYRFSW
jgi:hypothetical protein